MTNKEYNRLTLAEAKLKRWFTTTPMRTKGGMTIPRGHPVRIVGKCGGWEVEGDPCGKCGVQVRIRKVRPGDLVEDTGDSYIPQTQDDDLYIPP